MSRTILHIDMDAFFASVEILDNPELRGKPVVVGGQHRGVVAAASYPARRYGVRSAMPMTQALRLCPQLVVIFPRHARYAEVSEQVFAIFQRYTPLIEGLSLDEAFLDVTGSRALFGDGPSIAQAIRAAIATELHLTASAGVASSKFVAKIASDVNKPDGLTVVDPQQTAEFLAPLPIERMWGVGTVSAPRLRSCGLRTIGDIARARPDQMQRLMGTFGADMIDLARGIDPRPVIPDVDPQSVGAEETFDRDIWDRSELERHLLAQSLRVSARLGQDNTRGNIVVVKIKYADFTQQTRRMTLPQAINDADSIYDTAKQLLLRFDLQQQPVRLSGVSVTGFATQMQQGFLFPDKEKLRREKIAAVTAKIQKRFGGEYALTRATLIEKEKE